jgi:phosphoglycolate phosphatase
VERLILWDIDGTLIRGGGVSGRAFASAVEVVTGVPAADHGVAFGGKTDPQIAREILAVLDIHDQVDAHLPRIVAELERTLASARDEMRANGRVLPGVRPLLDALRHAGSVQTVLTGNTAVNAATKIDAFELRAWLDLEVGAFGSDHHDRNALVPVAIGRVEERYGAVDRARVWVVGDTPFDAACARAGGVHCLLVASGFSNREALDASGADCVVDDLENTDEIVGLLGADTPDGGHRVVT